MDEILSQIIWTEFRQYITDIEFCTKGKSNQNFFIKTDADEFIVKTNTHDALASHQKEKWCIERAVQIGVPVPEIMAVGTLGSTAYLIQRRLPGESGADDSSNRYSLWYQLGRYAKLIHSIPVTGYGYNLINADQNQFATSWEVFVNRSMRSLFADDFFLQHRLLSSHQLNQAKSVLLNLYQWQFEPFLNHGDLVLNNTIIGPNDIVYLIDWGAAVAHRAPHFDISTVLPWISQKRYVQTFLKGYGISGAQFESMKSDLDILVLQKLLYVIRWASEHMTDWRQAPFVQNAIQKINLFDL